MLMGAKIDIPFYDYEDYPYHVKTSEMEFDVMIEWEESEQRWRELGSKWGDIVGISLDNDDAIIYGHDKTWVVVVRNKDGIYQSRCGRIVAVSKQGFDKYQTNALAKEIAS